jgi:hypothetical protein
MRQQYIIDEYLRVERSRLEYIRNNQEKLKCAKYAVLRDNLAKHDCRGTIRPGRTVILP